CLVRTTTPEFLAAPPPGEAKPSSYDELSLMVERRMERLQGRLRDAEITTILDLRPIPRGLEIVDPRTLVSTTISRVMEFIGAKPDVDPMSALEQAFWRLWPACALLCFVPERGAVLCARDPGLPSQPQVYSVAIDPREYGHDGSGMIIGGDAFVAAF